MDLVAEVDDTVVVNETEFEGSTISADEFKELLLNTNMIINKRCGSFRSTGSERPFLVPMLHEGPLHKKSTSVRYSLSEDLSSDSET